MEKAVPLFKSLIIPLGTVLLAFLVLKQGLLTGFSQQLISFSVYLLLVISLVLSIGFKKSRFFFILLILSLNYLFQTSYPGAHTLNPLLKVMLPLNIFVFALLSERGITSSWGKAGFGWILVQVLIVCRYMFIHQIDLQAKYQQVPPLLINQTWQWLLIGVIFGLLVALGILKFNRSYGTFIGIIMAMCLGIHFSDNPLTWAIFSSAAAFMVITITIQDMYRLAFMDELTSLYSRRCFNMDLMRLSGTYTVAMLDIDHFKKINDTYGHDVGDQVLKYVTSFMWKTPRGAKAYRYGGEEFTIILLGINKTEAVPYLEKLRKDMSSRPFTLRAKDRPVKKPQRVSSTKNPNQITVTMSIGVADNVRRNFKPDDVVKSADKALYQAKQKGRNRTCLFN